MEPRAARGRASLVGAQLPAVPYSAGPERGRRVPANVRAALSLWEPDI